MNPTAQTSHFEVYGYDLRIWTGMYSGVPTADAFFIRLDEFFFANPKSPIFMRPLLISRFAGFMSLPYTTLTDALCPP